MRAQPLVLASASPRRRRLLTLLGLPHRVHPVAVDETPLPGEHPDSLAQRLSRAKARRAAEEVAGLILAADTVVSLDGQALGKPRDAQEAREMLLALRGRWHHVYTAMAVLVVPTPGHVQRELIAVDMARVHIRTFTAEEMEAYLAAGAPFDKAGAYAVQDPTFRPVDRVEGCWATVMGLPIRLFLDVLRRVGGPMPADPTRACRVTFGGCCQLIRPPAPPPSLPG